MHEYTPSATVEALVAVVFFFFHDSYQKAVPDMVKEALEGTQKALRKERSAGTAAMIDDAISKRNEKERGEVRAIEMSA